MRLSKEYGVNPTIPMCFICGENKNEIILMDANRGKEAPRPGTVAFDREPCDKCREFMKEGIILISVDAEKSKYDMDNPYRTGGWCVVRDEAVKEFVEGDIINEILKKRICFVPDEAWEHIGLPRGEVK